MRQGHRQQDMSQSGAECERLNQPADPAASRHRPQDRKGQPLTVKVAVVMAFLGLLVGRDGGGRVSWAAFAGLVGAACGLLLRKRITFWRGLRAGAVEGAMGGALIGFLCGALLPLDAIGSTCFADALLVIWFGVHPTVLAALIGSIVGMVAGLVTSAVLWIDTAKRDC